MDKELLKFVKLEELVLSANQIKEIDTTNLPPTLKVKEPRFHSGSWSQSCPETLHFLAHSPRDLTIMSYAKGGSKAFEMLARSLKK